ncbi:MAG: hypothetical protein WBR10_02630 [Candidatus Acidiferrum sp.]
MNMKTLHAFSFACITLLPISASAQCKDQHCQNLQDILYAAVTDFREFRASKTPGLDVSILGTKVSCQMTTWANNVPMYICYAQVPAANADSWCTAMLDSLRLLQPTWHFQITSPAADQYMDAGPPDCEIPPTGGPYLGQCPLHLQSAKQTDGTAKLYLWMSSLSSPYLVKRPPSPPPKAASPAAITNGCDDLCQGLKKAFESRTTAFEEIRAAKSAADACDAALKLAGAGNCTVSPAAKPHSSDSGTQYFCYGPESSAFGAEIKFRDIAARDAKQEVALYV